MFKKSTVQGQQKMFKVNSQDSKVIWGIILLFSLLSLNIFYKLLYILNMYLFVQNQEHDLDVLIKLQAVS